MRNKPAFLLSDGRIQWPLHAVLVTECDMDFGDFPYDCQTCLIELMAFSPDVTFNLKHFHIANNFTDDSALWCIPSACPSQHIQTTRKSVQLSVTKIDSYNIYGRNSTNSVIKIEVTLCRIQSYYLWGIYIPYTIVSILIPITFIIPPSREEHEVVDEIDGGNDDDGGSNRPKTGRQRQTTHLVITFNYNDRLTFAITLFLTFILFHATVMADLPKVSGIVWLVKSLSIRMVICGLSIMYVIFLSLLRKIWPVLFWVNIIETIKTKWKNREKKKSSVAPRTSDSNGNEDLGHDEYPNIDNGEVENGRVGGNVKVEKVADTKPQKENESPEETPKERPVICKKIIAILRKVSVFLSLDIFCLVGSTYWLVILSINGYEMNGKPYVYEKNLPSEDSLTGMYKDVQLI